ncbi:hypothetical protein O1611_g6052 [Lasiodiplodia mahajangana]|uniref:Uncharacterized protein n=1 Tax=Lasiodiplodia mahajangana TaxID=1108764 RepID=A0ACC2JJS8_9PEZI|nr:hypothetical protein O1611_g6052 [Lasiodiplodia mahajangana]
MLMIDGGRPSAYRSWNIGVESARHGRFQPQGYIATGSEVAGGDWRGGIFDTVALGVGDGWVGSEGGPGRTTKVYRVEGESYVRSGDNVTWESNRRLFPDGDGVIADPHKLPTVKYYSRGNGGEGKAVILGLSNHRPSGNMLFLNYGERARADAFYAQRLLQYREAVDQMEGRGMEVLHSHHNMKIKSFKIMTRAAKDLQRRAITEPEKAAGLKPYDGVLQVDITKSRGQYGCERRIYSPLLRKAIQGSYKEFTPWLEHLPPRLLRLIVDHQIAYGCVRVVFVALPGSALPALLDSFLESDIANRLAAGSNNQSANLTSMPLPLSQFKTPAIEHVQIRDAPVVGLRQAREAKCGRQLQTDTDHGHHFEYLAEFPDGSTHWYPSVLIAKDLTEEFEDLSIRHASEVAEITKSKGSELTKTPAEEYLPLHDEEIDGLVKHGHDDEHLDVCVPATLTFRSDWAKFETTTAGTTIRRDDAFDAKVYENVTFTNTSIMWGKEHGYWFQQRTIPFVIVNHGAFIDITVSHGRDGYRLEDMAGSASVTYAAGTYKGSADNGTAFSRTPLFKMTAKSYAIHLTIDQPSRQTFIPVEKVVWSETKSASTDGWISTDTSDHTLVMANSGKSGALLLQSSRNERVFVVVGVHNWVPWCDIVTSISPADSAGKVLAMYYGDGEKAYMRRKTLSEHSVRSAAGTNFRVRFDVVEGHQLIAKFSIG